MKSLKGTQTHKNLMKAYVGESQARNRYTFYGDIAKKQGYPLIKQTFDFTAEQERIHGKIFFGYLAEEFNGQSIEIEANYSLDLYQEDTVKNLFVSIAAETQEHEEIYPDFAKVAREEGFSKIATSFELISKIEAEHSRRFANLAKKLEDGSLFNKPDPVAWHCQICGHIHFEVSAPTLCAVCNHPKGYFLFEISQKTSGF